MTRCALPNSPQPARQCAAVGGGLRGTGASSQAPGGGAEAAAAAGGAGGEWGGGGLGEPARTFSGNPEAGKSSVRTGAWSFVVLRLKSKKSVIMTGMAAYYEPPDLLYSQSSCQ